MGVMKINSMERACRDLLSEWCHGLRRLQAKDQGNRESDGAIYCPACHRIHGRCFEAMYPFLYMAHWEEPDQKKEWIDAADRLFQWAQANVSQPDGSFLNDTDSEWKGTTVFNAIQLADCLWFHGSILPEEMKMAWSSRLKKAADFLCDFEGLEGNNINYPVSNGLALLECSMVLQEPYYAEKAKQWIKYAKTMFTENGLVFGEGVPRDEKSPGGCLSVDIGYNVEETLPSMALYGWLAGDEEIKALAEKSLRSHLDFMLEDGGWDNSFGTRNFKWTYWGSRTSDGCAIGYLLYREDHPEFAEGARRNLRLLQSCTTGGLLAGGPHYESAGQDCCVHHTFTHGKVAAGILDRKLYQGLEETEKGREAVLPRQRSQGTKHYREINTWLVSRKDITATITAYDWEYLPGGHVSGGTLSLLHHLKAGLLFCAGMGEYSRKEPANMQLPKGVRHQCLALRIQEEQEGISYSSIYENQACVEEEDGWIMTKGTLKDQNHCPLEGAAYVLRYRIREKGMDLEGNFLKGKLILPLISSGKEKICLPGEGEERRLSPEEALLIYRNGCIIKLQADCGLALPYGKERIFNLVPGLEAIRIEGEPTEGRVCLGVEVQDVTKTAVTRIGYTV